MHKIEVKCIASYQTWRLQVKKKTYSEDFAKFKVDELKSYLRERGIQLGDGEKRKRKLSWIALFMPESSGDETEETGCF